MVYAALVAFDDIGEPCLRKDSSGQSVMKIDKPIRQAYG